MKKIILAVALVCVAAFAEAASVNWTCTLVKDGNGGSNTGIAYLMLASDVADFTALSGKGSEAINAALSKAKYSYTPETAGKYTVDAIENSTLGLSDATAYGNAYLVIFNTATVSDSSAFVVTPAKDLTTYSGDSTVTLSFGSMAAATKEASSWSSVAAPEPTSGILLLLGMAGLALKRKRA